MSSIPTEFTMKHQLLKLNVVWGMYLTPMLLYLEMMNGVSDARKILKKQSIMHYRIRERLLVRPLNQK